MEDFLPFFTKDGSVGLYSTVDEDIFHSVYGAFSEAYDKFVLPANLDKFFLRKNSINILDICYGVGYNSKAFLNYFLKNILQEKFKKKCLLTENIYSIDTDNINEKTKQQEGYIAQIDTNNIYKNDINIKDRKNKKFFKDKINKLKNNNNYKIHITAIDTNDVLLKLSPLFKINNKLFIKKNTGINKIDKYLKNNFGNYRRYKCLSEVNYIILMSLLDKYRDDYMTNEIVNVLTNKNYKKYIDKFMLNFMWFYQNERYKLSQNKNKSTFLHNIYYQYLSTCYKNTLKVLKNNEISFRWITKDARLYLKNDKNIYDIIFLDGFTPSKCPSLWSFEFFKVLYNILDNDGLLLTYSNSPAVRNALLKNGFYIGKIYNENEKKYTGTIASKNIANIEHFLNKFEQGLLNTKAGIVYHDESLSAENVEILNNRALDAANSSLISSTQYIKNNRGDNNEI